MVIRNYILSASFWKIALGWQKLIVIVVKHQNNLFRCWLSQGRIKINIKIKIKIEEKKTKIKNSFTTGKYVKNIKECKIECRIITKTIIKVRLN